MCYLFLWLVLVEPLPFSEIAMRHNAALLEYCRTSISALSGSTAGILGLTGLFGFIFYFVVAFMMSVSEHFSSYCCVFVFELSYYTLWHPTVRLPHLFFFHYRFIFFCYELSCKIFLFRRSTNDNLIIISYLSGFVSSKLCCYEIF